MFRILVVEDDRGARRLTEDVLLDAGYEPITFVLIFYPLTENARSFKCDV